MGAAVGIVVVEGNFGQGSYVWGDTSEAIGQRQLDRGEVSGHTPRAIDLLQIGCTARAINEAIGKGLKVRD